MTAWTAVYRGASVPTAKVIAVSSEPSLVRIVARRLLRSETLDQDPVLDATKAGKRHALRLIAERDKKEDQ